MNIHRGVKINVVMPIQTNPFYPLNIVYGRLYTIHIKRHRVFAHQPQQHRHIRAMPNPRFREGAIQQYLQMHHLCQLLARRLRRQKLQGRTPRTQRMRTAGAHPNLKHIKYRNSFVRHSVHLVCEFTRINTKKNQASGSIFALRSIVTRCPLLRTRFLYIMLHSPH